jgi:8-oxo-dGTP diphosphatase
MWSGNRGTSWAWFLDKGRDGTMEAFDGCKVALFVGDRLLVIQRDDKPTIPYPGLWDFPGGGRSGRETPFATLAREVAEEVGLELPLAAVLWQRRFVSARDESPTVWFFVAQLDAVDADRIVLGDEGQCVALISAATFLAKADAIASLQHRLTLWLVQNVSHTKYIMLKKQQDQ